ncbi:MAG TPA: FAD-binding protein [Rubrobacter sp.]|nr:FAD-binding protein [Rubrobacter sp.]
MSNTVQDRTEVSNVRIIGSGAAGLHAAIAAHEAGSDVVVIGKSRRRNAHTVLAAGASTPFWVPFGRAWCFRG